MIAAGDRFMLMADDGQRTILHADGCGARQEKGLGLVDPDSLVGTPYGDEVQIGAKTLRVLRPSLPDLAATLRRKAQIITPKDAARIAYELGLGEGDRVLESGIGSGATTMALAWMVGDTGKVVVQELRDDFAQWAGGNLQRAGLADRVDIHVGDLTKAVAPGVAGPFDGLLLDQPEPWLALRNAWIHLAPGARVACYCPQVGQMEACVRTLQDLGAHDVRAMELIERAWVVKERGARPDFDMLGHTGFLVFGRCVPP